MYRKSDSFLPPVQAAETPAGEYDLYPAFEIGDEIDSRIEVLAERLAAEKSVVIDGYEGVLWEKFNRAAPDSYDSAPFFIKCNLLFKEKSAMFAHILRTRQSEPCGYSRTKHSYTAV